jgi:hypothetical protein
LPSLTVSGFTIEGGGIGIVASNVGVVNIVGNNILQYALSGIQVSWNRPMAGIAYIADNIVASTLGDIGIAVSADGGASGNIRLSNNWIRYNNSGIALFTNTPTSTLNTRIEGNSVFDAKLYGIQVLGLGIQINGSTSNTIDRINGLRFNGGATGRFIINNTIVNSFPVFP